MVNTSSAVLHSEGTSCNRPFGVRAQVICTAWFLLTKKTADSPWYSKKLDSFFRPKVPRLEARIEDNGGDGNEDDNVVNVAQHTADCEMGFGLQNNLKNCHRNNRLQAEKLDTLMVISAEGPPLEDFPFEVALMKWKAEKS